MCIHLFNFNLYEELIHYYCWKFFHSHFLSLWSILNIWVVLSISNEDYFSLGTCLLFAKVYSYFNLPFKWDWFNHCGICGEINSLAAFAIQNNPSSSLFIYLFSCFSRAKMALFMFKTICSMYRSKFNSFHIEDTVYSKISPSTLPSKIPRLKL